MEEHSGGRRPRTTRQHFHPYAEYQNAHIPSSWKKETTTSDLEVMVLANASHDHLVAAGNPAYLHLLNQYLTLENYLQTALYSQPRQQSLQYKHPISMLQTPSTSPPRYIESLDPAEPLNLAPVSHSPSHSGPALPTAIYHPSTANNSASSKDHSSVEYEHSRSAPSLPNSKSSAHAQESLSSPSPFTKTAGSRLSFTSKANPKHSDAPPQRQQPLSTSRRNPTPYLIDMMEGAVIHSLEQNHSHISPSFLSVLSLRASLGMTVFLNVSVLKVPSAGEDSNYLTHPPFPFTVTEDPATCEVVLGRDWIDFALAFAKSLRITFASNTFEGREQSRQSGESSLLPSYIASSSSTPQDQKPPSPPASSKPSSKAKSGCSVSKTNKSKPSNTKKPPSESLNSSSNFQTKKYPNIKYWHEHDFRAALFESTKIKGNHFLEDENGKPIPWSQKRMIYAEVHKFWIDLTKKTQADVPRFRAVSAETLNEYTQWMEDAFPLLAMCEGHWKSKRLWVNRLSTWRSSPEAKELLQKKEEVKTNKDVDVVILGDDPQS
ncbi:hypothetical protein E1B28_000559 [Marasmius oreades]|uniref:Uncharacterized protein n=1 Tax=Marasmius oreades TaxID=181124 RepID=A0A9P7V1Q1_9AGAR|nr:uncharacterized protein E1B28_000559 [Marasmius oreades]KAG7098643.1 hypothetical protein E1B28_000559 [Marasmius oreades]